MKVQGLIANSRTGETFVIERESDCDCPACAIRLQLEIVEIVGDMSFLEQCYANDSHHRFVRAINNYD